MDPPDLPSDFRNTPVNPFHPQTEFSPDRPDPQAARLRTGDTVGDFRLVKLLGQGGMGAVWEADEQTLQRRVALKLIRPERVDEKAIALFRREARAGGRLSHPGLVSIHSFGEADGVHYIAQELVGSGHNLAGVLQSLREQDTVPEGYYRETAEFLLAAAEAMQAAHEAGVIHRDLKPQNILVDGEGKPRITDFGLARIVDEQSLSGHYGVLGTYYYMSPEQAMAKSIGIDHRTDLFSLGVVMYELLTLKRPFQGDTQQQIQEQILWDDPPPPRSVRSRVPVDLSVICMKCLEKKRDHRYASMRALADDLRRHLASEPIQARPAGPLRRAQKWALRHPTRSAALGVGAAALLVISVLLVRTLKAEEDARRKATLARQSAEAAEASKNEALASARIAQAREQEATEARRKEEVQRKEAERATASEKEQREAAERAQQREAAERARAEAETANVLRLSDVKRLRDLETRAAALWPAHPDLVPALEAWLGEAQSVCGNLEAHLASLAMVRARSQTAGDVTDPAAVEFADAEDDWWYETLHGLVADLTAFADPQRPGNTIASVRARLEASRTIHQRSIASHAEAWDDAIFFLSESETYDHLEMEPQLGLVPLGEDPHSGLLEFWVVESGERPARDPKTDRWLIRGETGIVLVLLPGGPFLMGASYDPEGPQYDPLSGDNEKPEEILLGPFFLSKFELTQGQWQRIMATNGSYFGPEQEWTRKDWATHPVEQVDWHECHEALLRLGLRLPTEAQWEYGTRGGTDTPWWTGREVDEALARAANLADQSYARGFTTNVVALDWDDHYPAHAPIGRFAPNPFGLHDVGGNVWEWCADVYAAAPPRARGGDGLRGVDRQSGSMIRVVRGGSFNGAAVNARSAFRDGVTPEGRSMNLGVRPARGVDG